MEKPHTSTRTTTSATSVHDFSDFYNSMLEAILYGGPPDVYVDCEVHDVTPSEECQEFDCYGCEYKGVKEHHE